MCLQVGEQGHFLAADGTIERYLLGLNEKHFCDYINNGIYVLLGCKTTPIDEDLADVMDGNVADATANEAIDATITDEINNNAALVEDPDNLNTKDIAATAARSFKWDDNCMPFGQKAPQNYHFPGYCAFTANILFITIFITHFLSTFL